MPVHELPLHPDVNIAHDLPLQLGAQPAAALQVVPDIHVGGQADHGLLPAPGGDLYEALQVAHGVAEDVPDQGYAYERGSWCAGGQAGWQVERDGFRGVLQHLRLRLLHSLPRRLHQQHPLQSVRLPHRGLGLRRQIHPKASTDLGWLYTNGPSPEALGGDVYAGGAHWAPPRDGIGVGERGGPVSSEPFVKTTSDQHLGQRLVKKVLNGERQRGNLLVYDKCGHGQRREHVLLYNQPVANATVGEAVLGMGGERSNTPGSDGVGGSQIDRCGSISTLHPLVHPGLREEGSHPLNRSGARVAPLLRRRRRPPVRSHTRSHLKLHAVVELTIPSVAGAPVVERRGARL
mmetsp:Transcript_14688/g.33437  ORF Transcript_14688/g.33437 Transcript_14688/m.33437 type:complete len:347 (-) Transcript_14688:879-1919(-)